MNSGWGGVIVELPLTLHLKESRKLTTKRDKKVIFSWASLDCVLSPWAVNY